MRSALLSWYAHSRRDLPWRRTTDPYAIWVSEVMLQQTQVERVKGYWAGFLEAFPTVEALASAELPEVLTLWRGLGYYSRARNLHRAAQRVVAEHRASLPADVEALRALPGFGRYTAGAVASIAFGLPAPIVDGNVARVLSRLFEVEGVPGDKARERRLWQLATQLVAGPGPGDLNQALMELGATVCVPTGPTCLLCPVRAHCGALRAGRVDELPPPRERAPRKAMHLAVGVVRQGDRLLLARRDESGLFGGLWELPSALHAGSKRAAQKALAALLGPGAIIGAPLGVVERTLTHRDLRFDVFQVDGVADRRLTGYLESTFATKKKADGLGISSAMQAVLALAAATAPTPAATTPSRRAGRPTSRPARAPRRSAR